MHRILQVEFKKLYSSKIWWLILVGAFLPPVIAWLSLLDQSGVTWLVFIHVTMLIFNVQSLLTLSGFAAFLWAREHEENTIQITMCYPYPKHFFLTAKLILMMLVIGITIGLFTAATFGCGSILIPKSIPSDILWRFLKVALSLIAMHLLIIPGAFLIAILTRYTISGIIWGIINMCMCMVLYNTRFIQYLPPCIPFVLSDHLLGMDVMQISSNYLVHWIIMIAYFIIILGISYLTINKRSRKP